MILCELKINSLFKRRTCPFGMAGLNQLVTNKKYMWYNSDNNNCRFATKNDNVVMG